MHLRPLAVRHSCHNYSTVCVHPNLNPFPNNPWCLRVCSTGLLKTLWEEEKLLITSNFSSSRSVFYPFEELSSIFIKFEIVVCKLFQFGRVQNSLFGNGLTTILDGFQNNMTRLFSIMCRCAI